MFLIIGNEHDPCAYGVKRALEYRHHAVAVDSNPLGNAARLRWQFDSVKSRLSYTRGQSGDAANEGALQGVFVRQFTGLHDGADWSDDDLSYMHSEGMAALLAWLHALECPIVGRVSDDGWYRPTRPLPEWVGVLADCGLPTPRVVVTNVAAPDRLEREWGGRATYQPLTSPRRYTITDGGWAELANVMRHVPVCLTAPMDAPAQAVTLACGATFWSTPVVGDRDRFEQGIRSVAARFQADFIQLSYQNGEDGPLFTGVHVAPFVESHSEVDQQAMADRIAQVLS